MFFFNSQLLTAHIETFYGYGTYSARYWFVGMEEGGDSKPEGNANRIAAWHTLGRPEVTDLYEYHHDIAPGWFTKHAPIQPTWGKLIRILLAAKGEQSITPDDLRYYQRDCLGRSTGETCLLELLPLPSPSVGQWMYGEHTLLPQLRTRELYRQYYAMPRADHLARRVQEYKPAAVVFYSFDGWYRQWWERIAAVPFTEMAGPHGGFYLASNGPTRFVITKHPASKGPTNDYWHSVGRALLDHMTR